MREKMEKNVKHGQIDIKLSPGALTDIEFITQILQMVKFKDFEKIEKNTPKALILLFKDALLKEDEYQTLFSNYEFYREIEKFLRVSLWTKSNTIPEDFEKLEYLSLCLGYKFPDEFVDSVKTRMRQTREIFHRVIERITHR
jgi:glutamine synthetase adenylyltransferase